MSLLGNIKKKGERKKAYNLIKADNKSTSGTLSNIIKIIRASGIKRAAIVTKNTYTN